MKLEKILALLLLLLCLRPALAGPESPKREPGDLYENLDLFTKVLEAVRGDYVEKVDTQQLIYGAIRGMIATLDPHSAFLPPDVYEELKVDTEGKFGGVGIELTVKDNLLTVVSPIEGTPAFRAGIREGDRILKINGVSTRELTLTDAVRKMRGRKGEKITLTLSREGAKDSIEVTLVRDTIRIKSVRWELPEPGYGYVRVTSFQEGTHQELGKALKNLAEKEPLKGLVLDLRNNPGGLLDEAILVADRFLKSGTIVSTASRDQEIDKREAQDDGTEPDYPMVLLINGGSASASEIVAGALKDHHRAVVLGTTSFGKGSVQTVYELDKGAALKLTVARYLTPSGHSIQAAGIQPDVVVENRDATGTIKVKERFVRERDLSGHLEGEKNPAESRSAEDFQKEVALNYLKGLTFFSKPPSDSH